jgi:hypothetical protein
MCVMGEHRRGAEVHRQRVGVDAPLPHDDLPQVLERHDWPVVEQHFDDRRLVQQSAGEPVPPAYLRQLARDEDLGVRLASSPS